MRPENTENQPPAATFPALPPLVNSFARRIDYVRVSVTDRCDFRCSYCMSENMHFLPKADLLTLEELERLCAAFVARGVKKIRLTGGEPLVRRNVMQLFRGLSRHIGMGLDELTLTTNGSQLARYALELADCGVKRINVSLDTLDADKFRAITRWGDHAQVLSGIDAAQQAGLRVKINCVALKDGNDGEFLSLTEWAHGRGMDISFIEAMPLGEDAVHTIESFLPLDAVADELAQKLTLDALDLTPAAAPRAISTSRRPAGASASSRRSAIISARPAIGCASPAPARSTCASARRTRPICALLCARRRTTRPLHAALDEAMRRKPRGHDFVAQWAGALAPGRRSMSLTGG